MTPNGQHSNTAPDTYNAHWCNERHARLDREMDDRKKQDEKLMDRMGKLEARVAKIMGGLGVILVLIELVSKWLGGGG